MIRINQARIESAREKNRQIAELREQHLQGVGKRVKAKLEQETQAKIEAERKAKEEAEAKLKREQEYADRLRQAVEEEAPLMKPKRRPKAPVIKIVNQDTTDTERDFSETEDERPKVVVVNRRRKPAEKSAPIPIPAPEPPKVVCRFL